MTPVATSGWSPTSLPAATTTKPMGIHAQAIHGNAKVAAAT